MQLEVFIMDDKEIIELKHEITRLRDKFEHMEKEHDAQHREILQVTKDTNKSMMKVVMYFGAAITVLTVLSKIGVL